MHAPLNEHKKLIIESMIEIEMFDDIIKFIPFVISKTPMKIDFKIGNLLNKIFV